ncbi:MAG TPA: proline dehydrogenase family protein [Thermoanaerobaculia bacterium]
MSTTDLRDTELTFRDTSTGKLLAVRFLFKRLVPLMISERRTEALAKLTLKLPFGKQLVRHIGPFPHFCGGTSIEDCGPTVRQLARRGVRSILDYSAEGLATEQGFDASRDEVLRTIEFARHSKDVPFAVFKVTGVAPKELLEKVSSGSALDAEEQAAYDRVTERVRQICSAAHDAGSRVLIDAEESWIQPAIDALAERMMEEHNRERAIVYTTAQLYRTDRLDYVRGLLNDRYVVGVKLVRGAYMEAERERAAALGLPSPIHPTKEATDEAFDAAVDFCLDHLDRFALLAGTHNEASVARLLEELDRRGLDPQDPRIECTQLLGMSDNLSVAVAAHGCNASKYVPYGPLPTAIPYLIRRARENSSMEGQTSRELDLINAELARRRGAGKR